MTETMSQISFCPVKEQAKERTIGFSYLDSADRRI